MQQRWFFVPMPVYVPGVLSIAALSWAVWLSPWALLAIPFVWLGAWCSSHNMNLSAGFPVLAAAAVGLIVSCWIPQGSLIGLAASTSWILSGFERVARARPADDN